VVKSNTLVNDKMPLKLLGGKLRDFCSVADPYPGSGIWDPVPFWPLDPGSGIGFLRIPYPGSRDPPSQTHIFESIVTIFWVKSSLIL
jgi:hypothetical protein